MQYMLLLTPYQTINRDTTYFGDPVDEYSCGGAESASLLEERNNVAHAMHVIFATYREFAYPWQLFTEIIRQKQFASAKQFNFLLYYWLNNYPEDFWTPCQPKPTAPPSSPEQQSLPPKSPTATSTSETDSESLYSEYTSSSASSGAYQDFASGSTSSSLTSTVDSSASVEQFSPLTLADQLISLRHVDEEVKKHCLHLLDMKKENTFSNRTLTYSSHVSIHLHTTQPHKHHSQVSH